MNEGHAIPVLHSEEEIAERVEELAAEIAAEVKGELVIVSLLRGSFMFTSDLVRALYRVGVQPQIDFMTLSSYEGTSSTGEVIIHRDITDEVAGKTVLIVDDILETGRTLQFAKETLKSRNPKDIKTCMLLEKPGKLDTPQAADFVGFRIPDKFVIGYGLDYDNHYRELPYIGYLEIH
jgi:hypoxanthine phosphoribosyltransferase